VFLLYNISILSLDSSKLYDKEDIVIKANAFSEKAVFIDLKKKLPILDFVKRSVPDSDIILYIFKMKFNNRILYINAYINYSELYTLEKKLNTEINNHMNTLNEGGNFLKDSYKKQMLSKIAFEDTLYFTITPEFNKTLDNFFKNYQTYESFLFVLDNMSISKFYSACDKSIFDLQTEHAFFGLDLSGVIDMKNMFANCSSLTSI